MKQHFPGEYKISHAVYDDVQCNEAFAHVLIAWMLVLIHHERFVQKNRH